MAVFVLVHGGQYGAWCWTFVADELRRSGHDAIAVDLPVEDPTAGAARYADVVTAAASDVADEVVLVGHSLGGLTIPLAPFRRPVRRLVFLCAGYPEPGRHFEALAAEPPELVGSNTREHLADVDHDFHLSTPEVARTTFYHDVTPALRDWAIAQLRRQSRTPHREVTPLSTWPPTPRTLIHASDDRTIPRDLAVRRTRRLFGEDPIRIPGGHSPFLSRPAELAALLVDATAQRPLDAGRG